jgi:hypothetical protein
MRLAIEAVVLAGLVYIGWEQSFSERLPGSIKPLFQRQVPAAATQSATVDRPAYDSTRILSGHIYYVDAAGKKYWLDAQGRRHYER